MNNTLITDPKKIANTFNKYFSSVGSSLQNKIHHQYQAQIIFTQINNFKWTFHSKAPLLVVSDIQNEKHLSNVNVSIRDELFFMDRNSLKVYEAYQINEVQVTKYLGKFPDDTDKSKSEFMPSENYTTPIVKHRNNFQFK